MWHGEAVTEGEKILIIVFYERFKNVFSTTHQSAAPTAPPDKVSLVIDCQKLILS